MRFRPGLVLVAALVAGCAGGNSTTSAVPTVPGSEAMQQFSALIHAAPVYVSLGNNGNTNTNPVPILGDRGTQLPALWKKIKPESPGLLALDPSGDLYVLEYTGTSSNAAFAVAEYSRWGNALLRTIPVSGAGQIVPDMGTDGSGNLYVLVTTDERDVTQAVQIYAPGATTPSKSISFTTDPTAITVASNGTFYLRWYNASEEHVNIAVYPAGSTTPAYTIDVPYFQSVTAVDSSGNLYASLRNGVSVYPPGSKTPSATISDGSEIPSSLMVDAKNNLYIGNFDGSISVVSAGGTSPAYTIPPSESGTPSVSSMAVDPFGNLCTVSTTFARGGTIFACYQAGTATLIGSRPYYNATQIVIGPQAK